MYMFARLLESKTRDYHDRGLNFVLYTLSGLLLFPSPSRSGVDSREGVGEGEGGVVCAGEGSPAYKSLHRLEVLHLLWMATTPTILAACS